MYHAPLDEFTQMTNEQRQILAIVASSYLAFCIFSTIHTLYTLCYKVYRWRGHEFYEVPWKHVLRMSVF